MQLYVDGASLEEITRYASDPAIAGFTTNPSLMKAAGVTDYATFGREATAAAQGKPISFEIIGDTIDSAIRQAYLIADWGKNVFVKVPVVNSRGESMLMAVTRLASDGVQVNVTAVMSLAQIRYTMQALVSATARSIVSVFAGRIADTGRDPGFYITQAVKYKPDHGAVLWASTREIWNIAEAEELGADIITVTPALIRKERELRGRDLDAYSQETAQMFLVDAQRSGLTL